MAMTRDCHCLSKSGVFEKKLGTVKGVQVNLGLKPGEAPKFYKPRPGPSLGVGV